MVEQQETIRITAGESDVKIAIEGGVADLVFFAGLPLEQIEDIIPPDVSRLTPGERPGEYVITLEFERFRSHDGSPVGARARAPARLKRLDVHIRNITVRLRDGGYTLEGELAGWVGYTTTIGAA